MKEQPHNSRFAPKGDFTPVLDALRKIAPDGDWDNEEQRAAAENAFSVIAESYNREMARPRNAEIKQNVRNIQKHAQILKNDLLTFLETLSIIGAKAATVSKYAEIVLGIQVMETLSERIDGFLPEDRGGKSNRPAGALARTSISAICYICGNEILRKHPAAVFIDFVQAVGRYASGHELPPEFAVKAVHAEIRKARRAGNASSPAALRDATPRAGP